MVPFFPLPRPRPVCFAEAGARRTRRRQLHPATGELRRTGLPRVTCARAQLLHSPCTGLQRELTASPRAPAAGAGPFPWAVGASVPLPPAAAEPGAVRGLFPALPSPPDFCLSACERSFIGLFDVAEPRTVQTFIKPLPCGPWDYEY